MHSSSREMQLMWIKECLFRGLAFCVKRGCFLYGPPWLNSANNRKKVGRGEKREVLRDAREQNSCNFVHKERGYHSHLSCPSSVNTASFLTSLLPRVRKTRCSEHDLSWFSDSVVSTATRRMVRGSKQWKKRILSFPETDPGAQPAFSSEYSVRSRV